MDDQDRIRQLEIDVARLIDRCERAEKDRIHAEADVENLSRDLGARLKKIELWQSAVLGASTVVGLIVGFVTSLFATKIKSIFG